MKRIPLGLLVAVVAAGASADAHHSFAADYLENQMVSIEGEVVEFHYRHPHTWLHVMAKDEKGETTRFAAEWANPRRLGPQGIDQDTLKPGDYVIVRGSPGRNPAEHKLHLKAIERPADGWKWVAGRGRR